MNKVFLAVVTFAISLALRAGLKQGGVWTDTNGYPINAHGGGVLYYEGTYYWYGEHKVYGEAGNRAHVGVHVYSSRDLCEWTDLGVALAVNDNPKSEICDGCVIERPKVVRSRKTGKFVMFFHLELQPLLTLGKGYFAAYTGIAEADRPEGPFLFVRGARPNSGGYGVWGHESRDQTLFVDDDGSVWQFYSTDHNKNMRADRLTDDCLGYTGESHQILTGDTTEAPAIFKHNGTYWMIGSGCTGWDPNEARLYRADKISGPWMRLDCPCKGVNPMNGLGPEKTWGGQSTFVLPVVGQPGKFIAMFDMWNSRNQLDSRYIWLPVRFVGDTLEIVWQDELELSSVTSGEKPELPSPLPEWKGERQRKPIWYEMVATQQEKVRAARGKTVDLVLVGDSLTWNWETARGRTVFAELTNRFSVVNVGVAGDRIEEIDWRCRNGQLDGFSARHAMVLAGTNNIGREPTETIVQRHEALLDTILAKQPGIRLIVMAPFPIGNSPDAEYRPRCAALKKALRENAARRGALWIDFDDRLLEPDGSISKSTMDDGVHIGVTGYRHWLDALKAVVH